MSQLLFFGGGGGGGGSGMLPLENLGFSYSQIPEGLSKIYHCKPFFLPIARQLSTIYSKLQPILIKYDISAVIVPL